MTLHKSQLELCDVIKLAQLVPTLIPSLPELTEDGLPIVHKSICYFHLRDHDLPVRINAYAFFENRSVDIEEDINGNKRIVRYGVCSPCAEKRGMVLRHNDE